MEISMSTENESAPSSKPADSKPKKKRSPKRQGEIVELAFVYKAAAMGFAVAKPYGDSESYDFMLDSGGHCWRVQVKSTAFFTDNAYKISACHSGAGQTKQVYKPEQIDFVVGYVIPEDAWYVLPIKVLGQRRFIALYPHLPQGRGQFERYREAWCLMACPHEDGARRDELEVTTLCEAPASPCPPEDDEKH
jgi:PD-(D/E)XK endonuclease